MPLGYSHFFLGWNRGVCTTTFDGKPRPHVHLQTSTTLRPIRQTEVTQQRGRTANRTIIFPIHQKPSRYAQDVCTLLQEKLLMVWKTLCLLYSLAIAVLMQQLVFHGSFSLAGKNVIRPGNYIRQLLEAPEKNYQPIHQFTSSTLRDAFSLRVGPVPGVSNNHRTPKCDFARTSM